MKAAARFLLQAAFGPDQAAPGDDVPQNVPAVMSLGFSGWIDDQFTRPIGYLQPYVDWAVVNADNLGLYGNYKEHSWWARVMAPSSTADPLRQRVAFALSEILVVSDRPEQLAVEQQGMANFYDLFETDAFGNYRDLLQAVALHPAMGLFLSHLGNQKTNPATHVYPDENFAREVMQLFSIGLWMLNPDGTKQLDAQGRPIPTYNNGDITELARVFTGLSFGNNASFTLYPRDFTVPMKGWDAYHDLGAKTLIGGLQLPVRTASAGNAGTATMADVTAAVNNLFNHQNVGPFLALRLIQRLVTSNPSPAYIARVSAAFANNGSGVRDALKAVVRAILLDSEARDPAVMSQPAWGRLREPFLRCVNFAHALKASSSSGYYPLDQFSLAVLEDPMNSPSVFNFFLPAHSPAGPITQLGLVAPEFQIVNASSAVSGANYFWQHTLSDLAYWGTANPAFAVRPNINDELALIVPAAHVADDVPPGNLALDPDPLLRRLDLALTGGALSPTQFQIIREAMLRSGIGWGGRMVDLLKDLNANQIVPMQISLDGSNVWQTGNTVSEYAITASGATALSGYGAGWTQFQDLQNAMSNAVDSQLAQQYTNLLAQTFVTQKKQALDAYQSFASASALALPNGVTFPNTYVGSRLAMIAKAVQGRAALGAVRQTFFVQWGGWDHHDDVLGNQAIMLPQISAAIGAFYNALVALGIADKVTLFTASDFGRTLTSNSRGSDHAWGSNQLVVGGAVDGKRIFGQYPSLAVNPDAGAEVNPLDTGRGRFIPTTSCDQFFAELALWLGVSPSDLSYVLPNINNFYVPSSTTPPLGFMI